MQLFSIGTVMSVGYLIFAIHLTLSSAQDTVAKGYFIDIRGYKVSQISNTNYSTICSNVDICQPTRDDEFCLTQGNTQYYVSCPRIGYPRALAICSKLGGRLLQNHANIATTLSKFRHDIFYKCKKFWIYCQDCLLHHMHVTKSSNGFTHPALTSEYTEADYTTKTSTTNKPINISGTSSLLVVASSHEVNIPSYVVPILAGVTAVAVTICVITFCVLMRKKKLLALKHSWKKEQKDPVVVQEQEMVLLQPNQQESNNIHQENTETPDDIIIDASATDTEEHNLDINVSGSTDVDYLKLNNRHRTFNSFPIEDTMFRQNLALMGFVYTGKSDQVFCAYCGVHLSDWKLGDNVFKEHSKVAPKCSLVVHKATKTRHH